MCFCLDGGQLDRIITRHRKLSVLNIDRGVHERDRLKEDRVGGCDVQVASSYPPLIRGGDYEGRAPKPSTVEERIRSGVRQQIGFP